MTPKIGFACKFMKTTTTAIPELATKSTTIKWLDSNPAVAEKKLWDLMQHNVLTLEKQIKWVGDLPLNQRMFRITSDLLPAYTHQNYWQFYQSLDIVNWLERNLQPIGDLARKLGVRLSFHPGQFCVLASESLEVVENSIQEFEYHCDIIRWLGFGKQFQDFKCNVHIGGKLGPWGIKSALRKLSTVARNCLTIENAEYTWGLAHSLELAKDCALVLDIHHHWIRTGEYIQVEDHRIKQIIDSWRGVRPVIHYSVSREDVLVNHCADTLPDLKKLVDINKHTKAQLRAHSDMYWNRASNQWALSHLSWADIMCEAKNKNLATKKLLDENPV